MNPIAVGVEHESGLIGAAWYITLANLDDEITFSVVMTPHFLVIFIEAEEFVLRWRLLPVEAILGVVV